MSAAEKLRALDEVAAPAKEFIYVPSADAAALVHLRNVLPQIVAVVEAAENSDLGNIFDDTTMYPAHKRLQAALAALDAALSPPTGGSP